MYTPDELVARTDGYVARAIHLFDTWGEFPRGDRLIDRLYEIPSNWRDAIPEALTADDMFSDDRCVLARVMTLAGADSEPYDRGLDLLGMTPADATPYGFDIAWGDSAKSMHFVDLAMAWNRALGLV